MRELGRRLAELGPSERATLPLDDDVRSAIDELHAIGAHSHGARKRQLGFLAKRLRGCDLAPVEAALERLARSARASAERHHRLERWRDRLLGAADDESPADALTAYLDDHPGADRQRLRQLQRRALRERAEARPPAAARELFRLLRDAPSADGRRGTSARPDEPGETPPDIAGDGTENGGGGNDEAGADAARGAPTSDAVGARREDGA